MIPFAKPHECFCLHLKCLVDVMILKCIYNQQWQNSGNFSSISSISSNSSSGGGAASRHVNSFKSTSSSVPQSIYYVKGVGEGGGC